MIVHETTGATTLITSSLLCYQQLLGVGSSFGINSLVDLPIFISNGNNNSGVVWHNFSVAAIDKRASSSWWLIGEVTAPINAINDQSQNWAWNSCVGHLWKSVWDHHLNNNDLRPSLTILILTSNNHAQVFPDTISWFLRFCDILRTYLVAEQELFDGWIQWITLKRCSGVIQRVNPVLTLIKVIPAMASNPESCLMNSSCRRRDNLQL